MQSWAAYGDRASGVFTALAHHGEESATVLYCALGFALLQSRYFDLIRLLSHGKLWT